MLPTKGYFQDIECPFYNTTCGRPYCHFRHKRKPNEPVEDVQDTSKTVVPTYKPTPKSELANIHSKSHIPISYVPDLTYKSGRTARPIRIDKPTYKPTPLSILSSANEPKTSGNEEHQEVIKDIQEKFASNSYDPLKSEINFEDLTNEFDLIDDIISKSDDPPENLINNNLLQIENDIEKEQNKLSLLQTEIESKSSDGVSSSQTNSAKFSSEEEDLMAQLNVEKDNHTKSSQKDILKTDEVKEGGTKKNEISKSSSATEKHRKEEKRGSSEEKDSKKAEKTSSKSKSSSEREKLTKEDKNGSSEEKDSKKTEKSSSRSKSSGERKKHRKEEKKGSSEEKDSKKAEKSSSRSKSSGERAKFRKEEKKGSSEEKESKKSEKSSSRSKSSGKREKNKKEEKRGSSEEKDSKKAEKSSSRSKSSGERETHRKEEKKGSSKEKDPKRSEKSSKSSEKEKHKKEEKQDSSKEKHGTKRNSDEKSTQRLLKKRKKSKSESTESSSNDSSPERHRKEKKSSSSSKSSKNSSSKKKDSDRKKEKKSRDQSRSRSNSKSKHKSKRRSRSRTKDKDSSKKSDKDKIKSNKDKNKDKSSSKSSHDNKGSQKKSQTEKRTESESASDIMDYDNGNELLDAEVVPSDIELDFDDEDETLRECYKIFYEYKPEPLKPKIATEEAPVQKEFFEDTDNSYQGKKRTAHAGAESTSTYSKLPPIQPPKSTPLPGQILANRYKIAKLAQANNEQENIMNEIKSITAVKRPAATLLEAARLHKLKRLQLQKQKELEKEKSNVNIVDDILSGAHRPSPSHFKALPKKIAAVPNVALIEKAKERISLVKQQRLQDLKTVAHTQKGGRVAHVPEYTLAEIPDVLQADKSKLPVNVRTRFLTMIAEECSKLYALKEDAYNRALNEEFACYEKCKVLATYRNSSMLAVNRLRKEIQERESKGLGPVLSGEAPLNKTETDFEGKTFYNHVKRWILTEEELDIHGYPRECGERGKAIINNRTEIDYSIVDENYRKCSRCGKLYQVDDDGWALFEEECMYHPLKKRTIRGEQIFLCCKSTDDTGCAMSDNHVFDGLPKHLLEGYQTTLPPETDIDSRSVQVYALDCEMCYTTKGLELTRVTIVDINCKTVYESFVKPLNPIIDYNTRFSGITKEQMDKTSTSILQVQANILHLCNSETILVGHSLESDMKALKIVHSTIIDTSVLFPHKMGLPHKRALRALASEHLKKIIQNDVGGHDSAEDAVTCMDLIKWKLKEELKVSKSK